MPFYRQNSSLFSCNFYMCAKGFFFVKTLAYFVFFLWFSACRFRGERTGEKIIRLSEATPVGTEAFRVLAFPRRNFNIQALDGVRKSWKNWTHLFDKNFVKAKFSFVHTVWRMYILVLAKIFRENKISKNFFRVLCHLLVLKLTMGYT